LDVFFLRLNYDNITEFDTPNFRKEEFAFDWLSLEVTDELFNSAFDWLSLEVTDELFNSRTDYHGNIDYFFSPNTNTKLWHLGNKILIFKYSN